MADLSNIEKTKLFDFFEISGGFILYTLYQKNGKTKKDTRNIINDSIAVDIYKDEHCKNLSQQKCIEYIVENLCNADVSKLFEDIFDFYKYYNESCKNDCFFCDKQNKCKEVQRIIKDLSQRKDSVTYINLPQSEINVGQLYDSLQQDIKKGNFTLALDRLHTYSLLYLENLCKKHNIVPNRDKNNHLMFDDLLSHLTLYYKSNSLIDDFAEYVIKRYKEIFQKYNCVRNNQSYSHPNKVMDNDNAKFVIEIICLFLKYIDRIETVNGKNTD